MDYLAPYSSLYRQRQNTALCKTIDLDKSPSLRDDFENRMVQAGHCLDAVDTISIGGMDHNGGSLPWLNGTRFRRDW